MFLAFKGGKHLKFGECPRLGGKRTLRLYNAAMMMTLEQESARATELLGGQIVARVVRHREGEVMIEFADGSRFYADCDGHLNLSITNVHD